MKSMKDWIVSQLDFPLLAALRPNFGNGTSRYQESSIEQSCNQGTSNPRNRISLHGSANASMSPEHIHANRQEVPTHGHTHQSHANSEPMSEIERILVNFLRLIMRLGQPLDDYMVSKVLHRLRLTTLIRPGDSDMGKITVDRCKAMAIEQERSASPEVDFSIRILLIGRTGVGKSATINSIFGHTMVTTNAFEPATKQIHEVTGILHGVKLTLIDTPGLFPFSVSNLKENRKILLSIKRYIRRSPPDLVLYLERLDFLGTGFSDFSLLSVVTDVFGHAIWFNTIIIMTHSSSDLPEGPNGYAVSYESYSSYCKDLLRRYIHRAVSDLRLQNLVLMVENHPRCRTDTTGERILPNGEAWKSRFVLSCICSKVLSDVNAILKFQRTLELGSSMRGRSVSLPNLLSSLLRRSYPDGIESIDEASFSDEDDDYDQLPPIRILPKHQFEKLSKSQKAAYLDELDYREKLYMKKQFKERKGSEVDFEDRPEVVLLPDMVVPETFTSDCVTHRYRCFASSDERVVRPVLDPNGWDRDVGFDGINLDMTKEFGKHVRACLTGQISKDKRDLSVQSECVTVYHNPQRTLSLGLDAQSSGEDIICTAHSFMKMKSLFGNRFGCGISTTPVHGKCCVGTKVEDVITIGKKVKFEVNAGRMAGLEEEVAYGGSISANFHGKDYPIRNDGINLGLTVLSFNRELVLGGNFRLEFRPCRGTKMLINTDINSRKMGQICVKIMGSGCAEITLLAAFTIFKFLLRKKEIQQVADGG